MSLCFESNYIRSEKRTHSAIAYALEFARNRTMVMDRRGRIICSDHELAAVELQGRLKWTRALCEELEVCFGLRNDPKAGDRSFFWFSCADSECTGRTYAQVPFNPLRCIGRYRRGLRGLNYIAMLEPAIYASASHKCPPEFQHLHPFDMLVSWHTHGLAWGDDRKDMRARFDDIEACGLYVPLIPNLKGCWAQFIRPNLLAQKIAYMCKTPRVVNRVYCQNPEQFDRELWIFRQKEAKARPGEHIRYFKLLANYTLDQLAFGGGEGSKLLQRVKAPFIRRANA
jgi:hypothetical protein